MKRQKENLFFEALHESRVIEVDITVPKDFGLLIFKTKSV